VIGGISLRGMVIPVVDLRIVLDRPAPAKEGRNVVIVAHGDRMMGLLADRLNGIFEAVQGSFKPTSVSGTTPAVFLASAQRSDDKTMVSVLSTEALSRLHQVPMVEDQEPARQQLRDTADDHASADASIPMLLLACNDIPFAVEATVVHATLSNPAIELSELTGGRALNTIDYNGFKVPALDLLEFCGMGRVGLDTGIQALVVSLPAGYVAFVISAVVDVTRTYAVDVNKLPAFALPRPGLFVGSLPLSALPAELAGRAGKSVNQYLVIDAAALKACDETIAMSELNIAASSEATGPKALSVAASSESGRHSMITYMLETERASPLEQVLEILPYQPGTEIFRTDGAMLGFMVNRGRSIPVLCLGQLSGEACGPPTAASRVLLVESGGELIGFAVRKLNSIEKSDWEPVISTAAEHGGSPRRQQHKLALFGSRTADRMVPVLNLQEIADSLRRRSLQSAAFVVAQ
jgi:purine-binding chemotaxis protein CheW